MCSIELHRAHQKTSPLFLSRRKSMLPVQGDLPLYVLGMKRDKNRRLAEFEPTHRRLMVHLVPCHPHIAAVGFYPPTRQAPHPHHYAPLRAPPPPPFPAYPPGPPSRLT